MKRYFKNLQIAENKRLRYLLLAYLVATSFGLAAGVVFNSVAGIVIGIVLTSILCWIMTALVNAIVKVVCPLCNAQELTEKFTLQCRPAEFECKQCHSVYADGMLLNK
jgi:hypothetical protein